MISLMTMYCS